VSRQQLGTVVIMGMLIATMLGIFLVPVLFVLVERLVHRGEAVAPAAAVPSPVAGGRE
jgi:Cu/Ag efflux pump CusA